MMLSDWLMYSRDTHNGTKKLLTYPILKQIYQKRVPHIVNSIINQVRMTVAYMLKERLLTVNRLKIVFGSCCLGLAIVLRTFRLNIGHWLKFGTKLIFFLLFVGGMSISGGLLSKINK